MGLQILEGKVNSKVSLCQNMAKRPDGLSDRSDGKCEKQ